MSIKSGSKNLFLKSWGENEQFSYGEKAILRNDDGTGSLVEVVGHYKKSAYINTRFIVKDLKTNKLMQIKDPRYSLYSQNWSKKVSFSYKETAILKENNMEEVEVVGRQSFARPNKDEYVVWSKQKESYIFIEYSNFELFRTSWKGNSYFQKSDKVFYKDSNDHLHSGAISGKRSLNDGSNVKYAITLDKTGEVVETEHPKYSLFNQSWTGNSYFKSNEDIYVKLSEDSFSSGKIVGYRTDPSGGNPRYIVQTSDNKLHFIKYSKYDLFKSDWNSNTYLKPRDKVIYTHNDVKGSLVGMAKFDKKKYLIKLDKEDKYMILSTK